MASEDREVTYSTKEIPDSESLAFQIPMDLRDWRMIGLEIEPSEEPAEYDLTFYKDAPNGKAIYKRIGITHEPYLRFAEMLDISMHTEAGKLFGTIANRSGGPRTFEIAISQEVRA